MIGILQGMRVPRRAPALFRVKVGVEFSKNGSFQKSVRSKVSDSFCSGFVTTCETESRRRSGASAPRIPVANRWDEKAGLRRDAVRSQVIDVLKAQEIKETGNEEG